MSAPPGSGNVDRANLAEAHKDCPLGFVLVTVFSLGGTVEKTSWVPLRRLGEENDLAKSAEVEPSRWGQSFRDVSSGSHRDNRGPSGFSLN